MPKEPLVLIVGVCSAGKSTLAHELQKLGYNAQTFALEHSVSAFTWRRRNPQVLIFLDCSIDVIKKRKAISWGIKKYLAQQENLRDAREHADIYVCTDFLTPSELTAHVVGELAHLLPPRLLNIELTSLVGQ